MWYILVVNTFLFDFCVLSLNRLRCLSHDRSICCWILKVLCQNDSVNLSESWIQKFGFVTNTFYSFFLTSEQYVYVELLVLERQHTSEVWSLFFKVIHRLVALLISSQKRCVGCVPFDFILYEGNVTCLNVMCILYSSNIEKWSDRQT